jgi:hypothetical protein
MHFRDYVRRQLMEQATELGQTMPAASPNPIALCNAAIDRWYLKQDARKEAEQLWSDATKAVFREKRHIANKVSRLVKDKAAHQSARQKDADQRKIPLRARTDCSTMTELEKAAHHREVSTNRKRLARAKSKPQGSALSDSDVAWLIRQQNFGRF